MLVPTRLRQLSHSTARLVLIPGDSSTATHLLLEGVGPPDLLAEIPEPSSPQARTLVQGALRRPEISRLIARRRLAQCLRLPARLALRQTISLPVEAESNLSEVVGYELDRYTPFRADQVYFGYRVLGRDGAARQLSVEMTVVRRVTVDEWLTTARNLSFRPERIEVAHPGPDTAYLQTLLTPDVSMHPRARQRLRPALATFAAILAVASIAIPFSATEQQAAAMRDEIAGLQKRSEEVAALKKKIATLREDQDFVIKQKSLSLTSSELLWEITHLLPDDTWLTDLHAAGSDVELSGISGSASRLIGLIEQSGRFRETAFRSPIIAESVTGKERFSIATHVVAEHR